MKKLLSFLAAAGLFLFSINSIHAQATSSAVAAKTDSGQVVILPKSEIVNHDYFAAGNTIEISGTVYGDVYAVGKSIVIDGDVRGDVIAAGGSITISGNVGQNIRVAGGQIVISGTVGKSVTSAGGNVHLTPSATVGGAFIALSGEAVVSGPVTGYMKVGAGELTIGNKVGGDVDAGVGSLRLTQGANIAGNLTYWSNDEAAIDQSSKVKGKLTQNKLPESQRPTKNQGKGLPIFTTVISFATTLFVGLLILRFFPRYTEFTTDIIRVRPWLTLGVGFAGVFLIPIFAVLFMVTILGIPLGIFIFMLYFVSLYLSRIFSILVLGMILTTYFKKKVGNGTLFLIGAVVYYFLTLIPVLGGITKFVILLAGFGGILLASRATYFIARDKKVI